MQVNLIRCTSADPNFEGLIKLLDNDLDQRYGQLQKQYNPFNKVDLIETVVVAYEGRQSVGCGCFKKFSNDTVEIKRMFVKLDYRGKGISKLVLNELEKWALELGYENAVLETGMKQFEAIGLYSKCGYVKIENYGQYIGNNNSICMGKSLKM